MELETLIKLLDIAESRLDACTPEQRDFYGRVSAKLRRRVYEAIRALDD